VRLDEVKTTDFVLLALPTGPSMDVAARFLKAGARVIDLGSAFRLRDRAIWERVYGQKHAAWPLVNEAVYGIPELHEEGIRTTRLVANPGCFSSAAILGLAPLLKTGLVEAHRIVVNGLSGTAGAGAEFSRAIHHPEIGGNVVFYGSTTLNRDQVAPFATLGHERWLNAFRWTSSPLGWHPRWRRDLIAQQLGHGPRVVG
jgi:N-acetyl-gamma-glutamylphosphate reductase